MVSLKKVVIVGAGGHGQSVADVVESIGEARITGFLDDFQPLGSLVAGYEVLGAYSDIHRFVSPSTGFVLGLGQIMTPEPRIALFSGVKEAGGNFPPIVSPHSYVSRRAVLGEGTVVFHGAVVNTGVTIGRAGIINSLALVEHESSVGDFCHLATGSRINGRVSIGDGVFIGSGAVVFQGATIPPGSVIGAGEILRNGDKPAELRDL